MAIDSIVRRTARFIVQGDGQYTGDDEAGGDLAGMTLFVVRALTQVNDLLGLGDLNRVGAQGGARRLDATVDLDADSGLEIVAALEHTDSRSTEPEDLPDTPTLGGELDHVLDVITAVPLVAGAFLVAADGGLVADKFPGLATAAMDGTGRRMKVAHDAFGRLLGATAVTSTFEWARLIAAPVGSGIAVAAADHDCEVDAVVQAIGLGGSVLGGVDLRALSASRDAPE